MELSLLITMISFVVFILEFSFGFKTFKKRIPNGLRISIYKYLK